MSYSSKSPHGDCFQDENYNLFWRRCEKKPRSISRRQSRKSREKKKSNREKEKDGALKLSPYSNFSIHSLHIKGTTNNKDDAVQELHYFNTLPLATLYTLGSLNSPKDYFFLCLIEFIAALLSRLTKL